MPVNSRLGVYLGTYSITLVETENQSPAKVFFVPHEPTEAADPTLPKDTLPDTKAVATLQKALADEKITTTEVGFSVPTKDIVFRSFVIPWVHASEIKNVIEFEARKYIPFKLEEVTYTFHSSVFNDKAVRKIRILLVAVRNDRLKKYRQIFEQAGLKVNYIEPAPMSLLRALIFRGKIPLDQKIAVVTTTSKQGKIVILDQGVPQFIRDFKLVPANPAQTDHNPELFHARLFNEIRISLDYYSRQYNQEKISSILTLSEKASPELAQTIGNDLGIPLTSLSANSILGLSEVHDIDVVNAFGIGLKDSVSMPVNFDLTQKATKAQKAEFKFQLTQENIIEIAKAGALCIGIVALAFVGSFFAVMNSKKKLDTLAAQLGASKDFEIETLEAKSKDIQNKLQAYKDIKATSNVAFFLTKIPTLLPKGIWLKDIEIRYVETTLKPESATSGSTKEPDRVVTKVELSLSGFVYEVSTNQQIRLVNNFLVTLKNNKLVTDIFSNINLDSANTQPMGQHNVTFFKIAFK